MAEFLILGGLFLTALGAATILPFQSELVLVPLVLGGDLPLWLLFLVATVGNTLGSVITYWMGRGIERFRDHAWFPVSEAQLDRAERWYNRYGIWTLLLSWAPFGEGLVLASGMLKARFSLFLALVAAAKGLRYAAVIGVALLATG